MQTVARILLVLLAVATLSVVALAVIRPPAIELRHQDDPPSDLSSIGLIGGVKVSVMLHDQAQPITGTLYRNADDGYLCIRSDDNSLFSIVPWKSVRLVRVHVTY